MKTTPLAREQKQRRESQAAKAQAHAATDALAAFDSKLQAIREKVRIQPRWPVEDTRANSPYELRTNPDGGDAIYDRRVTERQIDGSMVMRDPKTKIAYDCKTGEKANDESPFKRHFNDADDLIARLDSASDRARQSEAAPFTDTSAWQDMRQTEKVSLFAHLFGKHGVDIVQFCETQQKLHKTVDSLTKHLQT